MKAGSRTGVSFVRCGVVAPLAVGLVSACGPAPAPPPPPPAPTATAVASAPPPPPPTATAVVEAPPVCKEPEGPRPAVVNFTTAWLEQDWVGWKGDASAPEQTVELRVPVVVQ